ncbi:MAG: 50S ribosomal protein L21 [Epulopiscium sp.]|nr:50S ribosomal protein L21 [Candidatus Epulonipiscium sp.]
MYAIIETGGKQYKVQEGDILKIEKLGMAPGEAVVFDKVIALSKDGTLAVGSPYVNNTTVSASVVNEGKNKKIIVYKYKAKKGYHKKQGHRQPYTEVKIEKING